MIDTLITLIVALLRAFVPAIIEAAKPTSVDGDPDVIRRDELRNRVDAAWGPEAISATQPKEKHQ